MRHFGRPFIRSATRVVAVVAACLAGGWLLVILVDRGPYYFAPVPTFQERPLDASELVSGFRSYSSIDSVVRSLDSMQVPWHAVERYTRTRNVPLPISYDQVEAEPFFHIGVSGRAVFSFLNDRLGVIAFCPAEPEWYFALLNPTLSRPIDRRDPELFVENVRIRYSGPVLDDGPCVQFSDIRVDREEDIIWAKYGSD